MIFTKVNLRDELIRERDHQENLLRNANDLLKQAASEDNSILLRLKNPPGIHSEISFAEKENVFTTEEIRSICIRYRLRFLDSAHFTADFPNEAIHKIKSFEEKYHLKFQSFRIIAPAESFDLKNINKDPLLFARICDDNYLLIHKWGNDLSWHRKMLCWPMQSFKTLVLSLLIFCLCFSFSLPASLLNVFSFEGEMYLRLWLTIHTFIGLLGLSVFAGISFDKSFSSMNWDSKYYNY